MRKKAKKTEGEIYLIYGSTKLCTGIDMPQIIAGAVFVQPFRINPCDPEVWFETACLGRNEADFLARVQFDKDRVMLQGVGRLQRGSLDINKFALFLGDLPWPVGKPSAMLRTKAAYVNNFHICSSVVTAGCL
jgi:hypothetical protein